MYPVVAEVVEEAWLHIRSLGVGVDIPQRVQCPFVIIIGEAGAVVTLLPEMPRSVQHPVEAHGSVPVEPVHDLGQIFGFLRFDQVVDMIAHDAEGVKLEVELLKSLFEGIEQNLTAFEAGQAKFAVIAPDGDVVGVTRDEFSFRTGHDGRPSVSSILPTISHSPLAATAF